MTCNRRDGDQLLVELDGTDPHVAGCPDCSARVRGHRQVATWIAEGRTGYRPPPDWTRRTLAHVLASAEPARALRSVPLPTEPLSIDGMTPRAPRRRRRWSVAVLAAAAAALFVLGRPPGPQQFDFSKLVLNGQLTVPPRGQGFSVGSATGSRGGHVEGDPAGPSVIVDKQWLGPRVPLGISFSAPSGEFGALTAEELVRVVKARSGVFRACYQKALMHWPWLGSELSVRIAIDGAGVVQSAEASLAGSAPDNEVETCTTSNLKRLKFPAKGTMATVYYVFKFTSEEPISPLDHHR